MAARLPSPSARIPAKEQIESASRRQSGAPARPLAHRRQHNPCRQSTGQRALHAANAQRFAGESLAPHRSVPPVTVA